MIHIIIHVCLWLTILFFVCVYVCVIMSRWLYILDADWELGDDKVSETDLRRHLPAIDCRVSKINCWEVQGLIDVLFWWLSKIYLNKIEHCWLSSVGGSDISNSCWAIVGCLNGTFSAPWFHFSLRWGWVWNPILIACRWGDVCDRLLDARSRSPAVPCTDS